MQTAQITRNIFTQVNNVLIKILVQVGVIWMLFWMYSKIILCAMLAAGGLCINV